MPCVIRCLRNTPVDVSEPSGTTGSYSLCGVQDPHLQMFWKLRLERMMPEMTGPFLMRPATRSWKILRYSTRLTVLTAEIMASNMAPMIVCSCSHVGAKLVPWRHHVQHHDTRV
jgi:hypothetical protein